MLVEPRGEEARRPGVRSSSCRTASSPRAVVQEGDLRRADRRHALQHRPLQSNMPARERPHRRRRRHGRRTRRRYHIVGSSIKRDRHPGQGVREVQLQRRREAPGHGARPRRPADRRRREAREDQRLQDRRWPGLDRVMPMGSTSVVVVRRARRAGDQGGGRARRHLVEADDRRRSRRRRGSTTGSGAEAPRNSSTSDEHRQRRRRDRQGAPRWSRPSTCGRSSRTPAWPGGGMATADKADGTDHGLERHAEVRTRCRTESPTCSGSRRTSVRVIWQMGPGSYGRGDADDAALEAAWIARSRSAGRSGSSGCATRACLGSEGPGDDHHDARRTRRGGQGDRVRLRLEGRLRPGGRDERRGRRATRLIGMASASRGRSGTPPARPPTATCSRTSACGREIVEPFLPMYEPAAELAHARPAGAAVGVRVGAVHGRARLTPRAPTRSQFRINHLTANSATSDVLRAAAKAAKLAGAPRRRARWTRTAAILTRSRDRLPEPRRDSRPRSSPSSRSTARRGRSCSSGASSPSTRARSSTRTACGTRGGQLHPRRQPHAEGRGAVLDDGRARASTG